MSAGNAALCQLLLAMADDELILGHRLGEWTGYGPILEEDMALSNIAQDELGHSLIWFTLYEKLTGRHPDAMAFERPWSDFTCCRFVTYPKGDFAYTIVRQYLFDEAEQVRLQALRKSSDQPIREAAEKILREEAYHMIHVKSLIERLGDATEESHLRMQTAVTAAFPQALGMYEELECEDELVEASVFPGNSSLAVEWLQRVVPLLQRTSLSVPVSPQNGGYAIHAARDSGGRKKKHSEHLHELLEDLQRVYRSEPGAKW